jgi:hypothetical protein
MESWPQRRDGLPVNPGFSFAVGSSWWTISPLAPGAKSYNFNFAKGTGEKEMKY